MSLKGASDRTVNGRCDNKRNIGGRKDFNLNKRNNLQLSIMEFIKMLI